ncbi:MAG: FliH/SctL family protein [Candidatus Margulisiibacteriota bacterium]
MGLIKRDKIKDSGEILIEKSVSFRPAEEAPIKEEEYLAADVPVEQDDQNAYAEDLVAAARREAQDIKQRARQEGFEEGRVEGRAESEQKIAEALETLNESVKERKKIIKDAESEILRLAIRAAEQIIRSEVSLHRDVCLNIVSEAINRVSDREQVMVKVNREDAEYIKRYKDRLAGILDGVKSFSILEDSTIEPGGCVVETNLGYVDARISTKLRTLEESLQRMVSEETPAEE